MSKSPSTSTEAGSVKKTASRSRPNPAMLRDSPTGMKRCEASRVAETAAGGDAVRPAAATGAEVAVDAGAGVVGVGVCDCAGVPVGVGLSRGAWTGTGVADGGGVPLAATRVGSGVFGAWAWPFAGVGVFIGFAEDPASAAATGSGMGWGASTPRPQLAASMTDKDTTKRRAKPVVIRRIISPRRILRGTHAAKLPDSAPRRCHLIDCA